MKLEGLCAHGDVVVHEVVRIGAFYSMTDRGSTMFECPESGIRSHARDFSAQLAYLSREMRPTRRSILLQYTAGRPADCGQLRWFEVSARIYLQNSPFPMMNHTFGTFGAPISSRYKHVERSSLRTGKALLSIENELDNHGVHGNGAYGIIAVTTIKWGFEWTHTKSKRISLNIQFYSSMCCASLTISCRRRRCPLLASPFASVINDREVRHGEGPCRQAQSQRRHVHGRYTESTGDQEIYA